MTPEENSVLVRLHRQQIRLWLLDDRDTFTDLRSILGGAVARFGSDELRLNPLHPHLMGPVGEDARQLGALIAQLTRHAPQPFEEALLSLQGSLARPCAAPGYTLMMPMLTLGDLRSALEDGADNPGWPQAAAALRGLLSSPLGPVLDGPTRLPSAPNPFPLQLTFARNNPAARGAVRGVMFRLADVMLRQHPGRVVIADVQRSAEEAQTPDVLPPAGVRVITVSGG